jgi:hypothetical protein
MVSYEYKEGLFKKLQYEWEVLSRVVKEVETFKDNELLLQVLREKLILDLKLKYIEYDLEPLKDVFNV